MNSPITINGSIGGDVERLPATNVTGKIIALDYLPVLKRNIIYPLEDSDNIEDVIRFMKMYNITREDWDTVIGLGTYSSLSQNIIKIPKIATKTKGAFTRKCKVMLSASYISKGKKGKGTISDLKVKNEEDIQSESDNDNDDKDENGDDSDDINKDSNIKQKGGSKKTTKKTKKTTKKK